MAGLLFTKRQGDWVTTSEREIQGRGSSAGSGVRIPALPSPMWDPGLIMPPLQASVSSSIKRRDKYHPICMVFPAISDNVCCAWHIVGTQEMVTIVTVGMAFVTLNQREASFLAFSSHACLYSHHPQIRHEFSCLQAFVHIAPSAWPTLPYPENSYTSFNAQAKTPPPLWSLFQKSSRAKSNSIPKIPQQASKIDS